MRTQALIETVRFFIKPVDHGIHSRPIIRPNGAVSTHVIEETGARLPDVTRQPLQTRPIRIALNTITPLLSQS